MLRAVVEVPFETTTLGIPGLDDPSTRGAQLLEMREHLSLEPLVLDAEPDGRPDLALEIRERGEVRNDRDGPIAPDQRGHTPAWSIRRLGDLRSVRVDERIRPVHAVRDPKLRVAHRLGERGLDRSGSRDLAEIGDDPPDGALLEPGPNGGPHDRD